MKVKNRVTEIIYDAEQFIPNKQVPFPVILWTGIRPRDMSFGYVNTDDGRQHVKSGDWIIGAYHGGSTFQSGCCVCVPDSEFLKYYAPIDENKNVIQITDTKPGDDYHSEYDAINHIGSADLKTYPYYISFRDNLSNAHAVLFVLSFEIKKIADIRRFEKEYSFDAKGFQVLSWNLLEN